MTLVSPACFIWASMSLTLLDSRAGVVPFNFAKSSCNLPTGPAIFSLLAFRHRTPKQTAKNYITWHHWHHWLCLTLKLTQLCLIVSLRFHGFMPFQAATLPQVFPRDPFLYHWSFSSHGTPKNSSAFGRSRRVKGSWDMPEQWVHLMPGKCPSVICHVVLCHILSLADRPTLNADWTQTSNSAPICRRSCVWAARSSSFLSTSASSCRKTLRKSLVVSMHPLTLSH